MQRFNLLKSLRAIGQRLRLGTTNGRNLLLGFRHIRHITKHPLARSMLLQNQIFLIAGVGRHFGFRPSAAPERRLGHGPSADPPCQGGTPFKQHMPGCSKSRYFERSTVNNCVKNSLLSTCTSFENHGPLELDSGQGTWQLC